MKTEKTETKETSKLKKRRKKAEVTEAGLGYLLSKLAAELVAGGASQEEAEVEVREKWRGMGQEEKAMWCRVANSET